MFQVFAPSPPVPAVSTRSSRAAAGSGSTCSRIASAQPAISSAVSPFARSATRKPAIWAGVASPRHDRVHRRARLLARRGRGRRGAGASACWITGVPALQEVARERRARPGSAPTRDGTGRRRPAARGGARPSPRRRCGVAVETSSTSGIARRRERVVARPPRTSGQAREEPARRRGARGLALPWTSSRAQPTSPPKTSTIAWWPRQTPSVGIVGRERARRSPRDDARVLRPARARARRRGATARAPRPPRR